MLSSRLPSAERAEVRMSSHVCVQAGHRQVPMVGSADQGGELHPQGRAWATPQAALFLQLQSHVLFFLSQQEKRIFTNFHRQLFCWIDRWVGLTMEDIRRMEDETQKELEEVVHSAVPSGLFSLLQPSCRCWKPDLSDLTLFTAEFHIRCVRRGTCEGPLRQTSRSL